MLELPAPYFKPQDDDKLEAPTLHGIVDAIQQNTTVDHDRLVDLYERVAKIEARLAAAGIP